MFTIGKTFSFAASHSLPRLPEGHKCRRLHGHNYLVTFELADAQLAEEGWVQDYADLDAAWAPLKERLDHQHLNQTLGDYSTAERLAQLVYDAAAERLPRLVGVRVQETPTTYAEYRP